MDMLKLKFMVVPEELGSKAYVPDAVRLRIVRPEAMLFSRTPWGQWDEDG
jgi:hypothetical protein